MKSFTIFILLLTFIISTVSATTGELNNNKRDSSAGRWNFFGGDSYKDSVSQQQSSSNGNGNSLMKAFAGFGSSSAAGASSQANNVQPGSKLAAAADAKSGFSGVNMFNALMAKFLGGGSSASSKAGLNVHKNDIFTGFPTTGGAGVGVSSISTAPFNTGTLPTGTATVLTGSPTTTGTSNSFGFSSTTTTTTSNALTSQTFGPSATIETGGGFT
ncbi:hypothetical protein HDU76_010046, partial [Blyttiomyces sp. JEL0837]